MAWKLFLDDLREPHGALGDVKIARTYDDAISLVRNFGFPEHIYFDHDLGLGKNGYDFANWIVEEVIYGNLTVPQNFDYSIHSMNPVGANNINCAMCVIYNR